MTDENLSLELLEGKPDVEPLIGLRSLNKRLPDGSVGYWFMGRDKKIYLRVYHHEKNQTLWFRFDKV